MLGLRLILVSRLVRFHPNKVARSVLRFSTLVQIHSPPPPLPFHPTTQPVVLRPYQQQCIELVLDSFLQHNRIAISMPVGSGKTVVFAHIIKQVEPPTPRATKTLVLAHREELLEQAKERILAINPTFTVEIEQGKRTASLDCDVVVASVPTLGRKESTRLERFDPQDFKLIIVDECHHTTASTYVRILEHFNVFEQPEIRVLGCSATLRRHDGIALGKVFQHIAFDCTLPHLWASRHLSPVRSFRVETATSLANVRVQRATRDFDLGDLTKAVNTPARNFLIVETWLQVIKGHCHSTLVFCTTVQHVMDLATFFWSQGVDARYVHGGTPKDERANIVRMFRNREFPVLLNCAVFTEGTDIPCIDCVLMARPTRSAVLYQQMVGRGLRLYKDKKECWVYDFVDTNFDEQMFTTPSLLGLSAHFDAQGSDIYEVYQEMCLLANETEDVMQAKSVQDAARIVAEYRARCEQIIVRQQAFYDDKVAVKMNRSNPVPPQHPQPYEQQTSESPALPASTSLPPNWRKEGTVWIRHASGPPNTDVLLIVKPEGQKLFGGLASVKRADGRQVLRVPMQHDSAVSAMQAMDTYANLSLGVPRKLITWETKTEGPATDKQVHCLRNMMGVERVQKLGLISARYASQLIARLITSRLVRQTLATDAIQKTKSQSLKDRLLGLGNQRKYL